MSELKDFTVTKANALVQASYHLTLNEQRLVLCCVAQLDSRKPLPKDNLFTVSVEDYAGLFPVDRKNAYRELEEAASALYQRDIRTYDGKALERFRWISYVKYHDGEGRVTLRFSHDTAPYLSLLYERFTSYRLEQIAGLRSVYAIRLFEFLMQYKRTGRFIVGVEDFKSWLELKDQYTRFSNLKARVIEPAVRELREKSRLIVEWQPLKKGRTVEHLEFRFRIADTDPSQAVFKAETVPVRVEVSSLEPTTIERFRAIYPGLDPYTCKTDFDAWRAGKKPVRDYDRAFLGFAKKWGMGKKAV